MEYTFYYKQKIKADNLEEAIQKAKKEKPTLDIIENEEEKKEIGFKE